MNGFSQPPRFLDAGEAALVVEFGDCVDPDVSVRVLALDAALAREQAPGIMETVPTYRSLMVHYDPLVLERDALVRLISALPAEPGLKPQNAQLWTIPCCYEGECGEDLNELAVRARLSRDEVVDLHSKALYRVYMYGFAPGFCYLGGLPDALSISRRETPRPPTPPNVVLVAGGLSLISTVSMPTGWWLIGTTPERMFSSSRDPIVLASVGDTIRFEPVDCSTFAALEQRAAAGEVVSRREALAA